ncbi:MAG: hypothetical protein ACTSW3_06170 [Promethearchaeota archaeon]
MIKEAIRFLSNDYVKAMLFGFMVVIIAIEYIELIYVRILLYIIAVAIALRPSVELKD